MANNKYTFIKRLFFLALILSAIYLTVDYNDYLNLDSVSKLTSKVTDQQPSKQSQQNTRAGEKAASQNTKPLADKNKQSNKTAKVINDNKPDKIVKPAPGWDVKTLNISDILVSGNSDYKFTLFDTEKVSFRGREELAELYVATGKDIKVIVALKPNRLLLHEVIVQVSTRLRWRTANEFQEKVEAAYADIVESEKFKGLVGEIMLSRRSMEKNTNTNLDGNTEANIAIKSDYKPGKYMDNYSLEKASKALQIDYIYNKKAVKSIKEFVTNYYKEKSKSDKDLFIRLNKRARPRTIMLAGGPASGKSTYSRILKSKLVSSNIDWRDVVKINPDFYKELLITDNIDKKDIYQTQLVLPEAELIGHYKVKTRVAELITAKKIQHVFWDQVLIDPKRVDLGLQNYGTVAIELIATDVESAIMRSYKRGNATDRYEPTQVILQLHQKVAEQLPNIISDYASKNVYFSLKDNNSQSFSIQTILEVHNASKEIVIHDKEKLKKFIKKININTKAINPDSLYTDDDVDLEAYFKPFIDKKYLFKELL